jgi:DNA gyrase/topoisomerase IV subunit A
LGFTEVQQGGREYQAFLDQEVEKRYLAYALSTIVSRALPDVRDGLKPVHRRILYAMHVMKLGDAARMRKSAAVVGEVIGKYHPHGDQAAYDAMVRMAQDFSLRYPLVEGSGNFGSVDGDSPAAMRYTEVRLSSFASLLLRDIDQGTTEFRDTYDAMGREPDVLPSAVPNLLLNGASGIAVGMSCSFPPHNMGEVIEACREAIRHPEIDTEGLLEFIKGPDFPTGGEVLISRQNLRDAYRTGYGFVRVRATFSVENVGKAKRNLVVTSIPYSVNKSRLIERIASLITDKKLKYVNDVRDESAGDVRIVLELKGDVSPEIIMAFLYKNSDLQINFPINLICITPAGTPERLSLSQIVNYFLAFRFEKTTLRLRYKLAVLLKRIHLLEGLAALFDDLDLAIRLIRSSRNREEAFIGLKKNFELDDEQADAVLEMRLYRLVGIEIGKLLDELAAKKRDSAAIEKDLASSGRIWRIVDKELAEIATKFSDSRRSSVTMESETKVFQYSPEEFLEREDATVILSQQGWIRRIKGEILDENSLKFREGDGLLGYVRLNTDQSAAILSNLGKIYVIKARDVPYSTGFGESIGNLFTMADGEIPLTIISAAAPVALDDKGRCSDDSRSAMTVQDNSPMQSILFPTSQDTLEEKSESQAAFGNYFIVAGRLGRGFKFDREVIKDPTKRTGRKLVNLDENDAAVNIKNYDRDILIMGSSSGRMIALKCSDIPVLSPPAAGVRLMRLGEGAEIVSLEVAQSEDLLSVNIGGDTDKIISVRDIPIMKRGTQGKKFFPRILSFKLAQGD